MIFIDTNYLIRFFTKDIEDQARKAKRVIEKEKIYVTEIVLAETVYILETYYEASKDEVCDKLFSFLQQPNVSSTSFAVFALEIYKSENISFYDCLLISQAIKERGEFKTFDERLAKFFSKYLQNKSSSN